MIFQIENVNENVNSKTEFLLSTLKWWIKKRESKKWTKKGNQKSEPKKWTKKGNQKSEPKKWN